jgi:hypothetical protein
MKRLLLTRKCLYHRQMTRQLRLMTRGKDRKSLEPMVRIKDRKQLRLMARGKTRKRLERK